MARHGENIRKRKDGRWEGRYKVFDEKQGKTVYRSVYGRDYEEVKEKLSRLRLGLDHTDAEKPRMREEPGSSNQAPASKSGLFFSQTAEMWLTMVAEKQKYSTYVKYSTVYRTHLAGIVGDCLLSVEGLPEIQSKIFDHLSETTLSESTRKSIYCVANQILAFANRIHSFALPLLKRPLEKSKKKPVAVLSRTEQAGLFACLYHGQNKYKLAVLLCLHTGLRLGEVCALKWTDLDFQNRLLTVERTVQRIAIEGYSTRMPLLETAPKSESSRRVIPLTEEMLALLIPLKKDSPYVFGDGRPLEPRTMQYRFKKILREAGIDNRKFHILRHTFATNCVENRMDVKALSELLGHSDVKLTLNRYVHPTMDSKRKQMGALADFYGQIYGQKG